MEDNCSNCGDEFKAKHKGKGYWRYSLENNLTQSDTSARAYLSSLTNASFTPVAKKRSGKFLCPACWSNLSDSLKYRKSLDNFWERSNKQTYVGFKVEESSYAIPSTSREQSSFPGKEKPLTTSTPVRRSKSGTFAKGIRSSRWDAILNHIRSRRYSSAIRGLYNATASSRKHFNEVVAKIIRREIADLFKLDLSLFKDTSLSNISSFTWNETLEKFASIAPLSSNVLTAVAATPKSAETLARGRTNLKPMLGLALAILLHAKAPRKASFIQTLFSVQLWRGGLKKETLKQLSRTGVCLGYKGTVNAIDNIRQSFDAEAKQTKQNLQVQLSTGSSNMPVVNDDELELSMALCQTVPDEDVQDDEDEDWEDLEEQFIDNDQEEEEEEEEEIDDEEDDVELEESEDICLPADISGISPIFEDPQIEPQIELHPGFTLCWDNVGKKVITRNPTTDKSNVYMNMALGYLAVNRVPVTHLEAFNDRTCTPANELPMATFVPDEEDMNERNFRMSTVIGRILTRHLPWFRDNFTDCVIPHIVHMHSNEMRKKSVIVNLGVFDENPSSTNGAIGIYKKLQEYVPAVDNKPYPTVVYGDGLSCERGNSAHNARAGELDAWQRLEALQPSPQEFHKEMLLLQGHYNEFCKQGAADVGTMFFLKNMFNFREVKPTDTSNCFSDAWELMCLATEGYVCLSAVEKLGMGSIDGKPNDAPDGIEDGDKENKESYLKNVQNELMNFYNASQIPSEPSYQYCICRTDLGEEEPMVGCAAGGKCTSREWYHVRCLGLTLEDLPKGEWYCSDECSKRKKGKRKKSSKKSESHDKTDYKTAYCKAMVWRGLNLLCRRDAVREGDGEAMLRYWKFDLQYFLEKKHPKYVILAHRLLCAVHGWLPEKLREELIWNRTVNYSGGVGRNLPMDLINELLNRLFKDQLDAAKGRYTDDTIQRCAQIIGPLGESLDEIFDQKVIENELYRHRRRARNRDSNIQKLLKFLLPENLFRTSSGRHFQSYPGFHFEEKLNLVEQNQNKLKRFADSLVQRKDVTLNN